MTLGVLSRQSKVLFLQAGQHSASGLSCFPDQVNFWDPLSVQLRNALHHLPEVHALMWPVCAEAATWRPAVLLTNEWKVTKGDSMGI